MKGAFLSAFNIKSQTNKLMFVFMYCNVRIYDV